MTIDKSTAKGPTESHSMISANGSFSSLFLSSSRKKRRDFLYSAAGFGNVYEGGKRDTEISRRSPPINTRAHGGNELARAPVSGEVPPGSGSGTAVVGDVIRPPSSNYHRIASHVVLHFFPRRACFRGLANALLPT
jgi:hypothetical protein